MVKLLDVYRLVTVGLLLVIVTLLYIHNYNPCQDEVDRVLADNYKLAVENNRLEQLFHKMNDFGH